MAHVIKRPPMKKKTGTGTPDPEETPEEEKKPVKKAPEEPGRDIVVPVKPETHITMGIFNEIREQAAQLIRTGFLPVHIKTAEQAVAVVLMGRELGIPMMQALRGIYVVQGTPALASQMMLALANRTGEVEECKIEDNGTTATVTLKRRGRAAHVETFSMADAEKMGLVGKDNWRKQPKIMRRWRAVSAACRFIFPDACAGTYTLEERNPDALVDADGYQVHEAPEPVTSKIAHAYEAPPSAPYKPETPVHESTKIVTPGPAETKGEQSPSQEAAVKDRLGTLFGILSGPAKLDKVGRLKWMSDKGFPKSLKEMTVEILDKAISVARSEFAEKSTEPATKSVSPAKQEALHKVFGLREKAGFESDEAVRTWVKTAWGKGLSEMSDEELAKVVERIAAFASLLANYQKFGFEVPAALVKYVVDVRGKPFHSQTVEELKEIEQEFNDLL